MVQLWELLKVVKNTKNLSWLWSTQEKTLRPSSVCVSVWFFKDCKIGSLKWFWDPTLQFLIEWRLWDVWDSFFSWIYRQTAFFTDKISVSWQTASVSWVSGVLLKDCYDSSSRVSSRLWSAVRERERSHRQQPRSGRPSLWPGLGGACAVRPGGQRRPAVQCGPAASRERERESGQCPVSVPGGQSWCDHSVSHYTVHELHPHPHQHNCAACEHCYVSSEQLSKTESQCKVKNCFFFKQALQKFL